jgi:hypothetical protein
MLPGHKANKNSTNCGGRIVLLRAHEGKGIMFCFDRLLKEVDRDCIQEKSKELEAATAS